MKDVRFVISAERCPQVLCRLIGVFAQQDRLTDHVEVIAAPRRLQITITIANLDDQRAAIIAEKMRQMIKVRSVRCSTRRR
jgi:hypothetical protein